MTDGFAIVDKPAGMTSHDVVGKARKQLSERRIGHAGTLDPDATGVLLLGIGRATRLLQFLSGSDKTYVAEIELGTETDTLDAAGVVTATHDMRSVTAAEVVAATAQFVGDIDQIPPMVSAIKIDGRRLHELAREGIEIERPARHVHVERFDIEPLAPGIYRAEIDCSSGTYIRSLAADLGRALGGGAHLRALRRTRVGRFGIDEACPLDALELRPTLEAMRGSAVVAVDEPMIALIRNGRVFARDELGVGAGDGPWCVVSAAGELLAVYASHGPERVKPTVVLVPS
ncbi:MAG: tRNA pseudouridine(55) synthase TruB [Acidimicrobiales bacterium]